MKKKGEIWIYARFMWNLNESRSSLFLNTRARKDMCKISVKLLTYYMYSKVVGIVRVDQQETAVWIIRLTLGLGLFCIKLIGIKFIADAVDTVPAVAECTSYTAWRCNRKFLQLKWLYLHTSIICFSISFIYQSGSNCRSDITDLYLIYASVNKCSLKI